MDSDASMDKEKDKDLEQGRGKVPPKGKEEKVEEKVEEEVTVSNFNGFATKKTFGQGALDLALLVANVKQLLLLDLEKKGMLVVVVVVALCTSILLQLIVGVMMFIMGYMDLEKTQRRIATNLNNTITVFLTVIAVINILVISVIDV